MNSSLPLVVSFAALAACSSVAPHAENPREVVLAESDAADGDPQIDALLSMMRAVNAGDAERYASHYADDAVITIHGTGTLEGRAAIQAHEDMLLREFPGARLAFHSVWLKSPVAVVRYAVNANDAAGQAMGHEGLLFLRFDDSWLIEEEHRYLDSLTPMAQMGALGPVPARAVPTLASVMRAYAAEGSTAERDNVATVKASFAAFDSTDRVAFLSMVTDDAVVDELSYLRPFLGKERIESWLDGWNSAVPKRRTEIVSILGVGEFVLVELNVHGTLNGSLDRITAAQSPFTVHRAAIVELKHGRLAAISCFMNAKELAEAVGQWPPRRGE